MPKLILVMLGGAIGAGFRYHLSRVALQNMGPGFPWGTFIANLLGALLMGVLAGFLLKEGAAGEPLRLFLGVGVLGGFTTFSAFSLEMMEMLGRGEAVMAASYAVSSVAGALMLLIAGYAFAKAFA